MTGGDESEWNWRDVERVIEDLKRDGYRPTDFKSNTSEPRDNKAFLLRVERGVDTDGDGDGSE